MFNKKQFGVKVDLTLMSIPFSSATRFANGLAKIRAVGEAWGTCCGCGGGGGGGGDCGWAAGGGIGGAAATGWGAGAAAGS